VFSGSEAISMDAKGRLAIPARYRAGLDAACKGHLVVTAHHIERCLLVYPEPLYQELAEKVKALPNIQSKGVRRLQRLLLGYATPLEMDSNGRILLSPTLRDYAGLDKGLMISGVGDKLEIWNESSWSAWLDEAADAADLPQEALSLNL
jgi:MraZ protein